MAGTVVLKKCTLCGAEGPTKDMRMNAKKSRIHCKKCYGTCAKCRQPIADGSGFFCKTCKSEARRDAFETYPSPVVRVIPPRTSQRGLVSPAHDVPLERVLEDIPDADDFSDEADAETPESLEAMYGD